jgi:UPF0716 protein FxsA
MLKLLLLFTLMPLVEIWILIELGAVIGSWATILLIASTGFVGVFLARSQGFAVLYKMRKDMEAGLVPADQFFDGACILIGGALLITPGLLTDLLGFSLLIPQGRIIFKSAAYRYLNRRQSEGKLQRWWN